LSTEPVALNEIKFACPHCHQHIACDEGYCGYQIACPACQGGMIVPRLAAFGFGAAANLALALPVATPIPRQVATSRLGSSSELYPRPKDEAFWTEQDWRRHVEKVGGGLDLSATYWQVLALVFLALVLLGFNLPTGVKLTTLILAGLAGGFLITTKKHGTGSVVGVIGGSLFYALVILGGSVLVGLGLIFGACALMG